MRPDSLLPSRRRGSPRRGRGLTLIVAVGAIGLGYLLWHRVPAPAPTPHAWLAPNLTTVPNLKACWLETGRFVVMTASSILVRHPTRGDLVIDAGNSTHFSAEIAPMSGLNKLFARLYPGMVRASLPMPDAVKAARVDPNTLQALLLSHLHPDHLGGVMDLSPHLPIWTTAEELAFVPQARAGRHGVPSEMDVLSTRGRALTFAARPYENFDSSADLFGDGAVVVVKLPGHTPGSLGVFVNLSPTRRLFYVGDAVNEISEIEANTGKRGYMRITDNDQAGARETVAKLHQLHEQDPGLLIIPAHERAAFEHAFGGGPACIP